MKKHNHADCECEICKNGLEAVEAKEQKAMQDLGWYAHYVQDDPEHPFGVNYHTHGLGRSFNHLDLQICLRVNPDVAHMIITNAVEKIKEGFKYQHGKAYDDLIEARDPNLKYKVLFLEARECGRPVLRLIMPDKKGSFDGDLAAQKEGCKPY